MEGTVDAHFDRIKGRIDKGRAVLEQLYARRDLQTFPVPQATPDQSQITAQPPKEGDPYVTPYPSISPVPYLTLVFFSDSTSPLTNATKMP